MAAIENILAWAKQEQARLAHRLEQLQTGRLHAFEKHAHAPGWLEIDTTTQTIELCQQYISELNAIVARYPEIVPTTPVAPAPAPRFVPTVPLPAAPAHPPAPAHLPGDGMSGFADATHPGWVNGWGVVKGQPPKWQFAGIYSTHAEANEALLKPARAITRAGARTTTAAGSLPAVPRSTGPIPYRNPIDSQGIAATISSDTTSAPI